MKHAAIISRGQSLQILRNELLKAALEKHADELASATAKERQEIISRIERDVQKEIRHRIRHVEPHGLLH